MGYYNLSDSDDPEIKEYTYKIGALITLLNYLDFHIQIFVEAILELDNNKSTTLPIIMMTRNFDFSRRVNFLKTLIKSKHKDNFGNYEKLHGEIIKCSELRNKLAHSQMYFWDDPDGTHMFVSSMKKTNLPPEKSYDQITMKELESNVERFKRITQDFHEFTWGLGYFQG